MVNFLNFATHKITIFNKLSRFFIIMTKLFNRPVAIMFGGVALLLSGCVDDSYDLSNIDDTMRIEVKNLTIPLRFEDGITFSDLIDTDQIEIIDNEYVILREGRFESEEIQIAAISGTPDVKESTKQIPFSAVAGTSVALPSELLELSKFEFDFEYNEVDRFIRAITGGDVDLDITLSVNTGISCTYNDLWFVMPKGMTGHVSTSGNYTATEAVANNTSTIKFTNVHTTDGKFEFTYHVDRLTLPANAIEPNKGAVAEDGTRYGRFYIASEIALEKCSITADQTAEGNFEASLELGAYTVHTIDGAVKYKVDDFQEKTELGDLPDLLKDPKTHLSLTNPQIYLSITNPFAINNVQASTGVEIKQGRYNTSNFIDGIGMQASTTSPIEIKAEAEQAFVLSPKAIDPSKMYVPGSEWKQINGLGDIVYGKGMPDYLDFRFYGITLDSDNVKDFPIGKKVDGITGSYTFYAPLDFGENAQVVYTQEQSGWDIQDMVVTGLEITADVTSTIPVAVKLNAYPIVKEDGKSKVVEDIEITSTEIGGKKENEPVTIKMNFKDKKELTGLDGMRYTATLISAAQGAIGPNQELSLKNLRVNISGYYDINGKDK